MDETNPQDSKDPLREILSNSGFVIVPMQTVIDALAEMEEYMAAQTDMTREELQVYLNKVEEVVGKEEALSLDTDEIISWIKAVRGY